MMKILFNIIFISYLTSCAISTETQQAAEDDQNRTNAERIKVATHGTMKGTPDNIDGIKNAEVRADSFQEIADEQNKTIFEKILVALIQVFIWD